MTTRYVGSNEARQHWRWLLDTIADGDEDVVIARYGKPVAAMVRYEDYMALQAALSELRDWSNNDLPRMLTCEELLARGWDAQAENEEWAGWSEIDRLAAAISEQWPNGVSAVDAVKNVRREL